MIDGDLVLPEHVQGPATRFDRWGLRVRQPGLIDADLVLPEHVQGQV